MINWTMLDKPNLFLITHFVFALLCGLCESRHSHAVEDLREDGPLHLGRLPLSSRRKVNLLRDGILEMSHQKIAA